MENESGTRILRPKSSRIFPVGKNARKRVKTSRCADHAGCNQAFTSSGLSTNAHILEKNRMSATTLAADRRLLHHAALRFTFAHLLAEGRMPATALAAYLCLLDRALLQDTNSLILERSRMSAITLAANRRLRQQAACSANIRIK